MSYFRLFWELVLFIFMINLRYMFNRFGDDVDYMGVLFLKLVFYVLFCENRFRKIRDMSPFRGCERREAERGRSN